MANRDKKYNKNRKFDSDIVFSDIRLTAEDKKKFRALETSEIQSLLDDVIRMVSNGHKLSVAYVESSDSFIASVTCKLETHVNFNVCLTSYSDDAWSAIALAAYKTRYCCANGEWLTGEEDDKLK